MGSVPMVTDTRCKPDDSSVSCQEAFESQSLGFPTLTTPYVCDLTCLDLSFLICKMGGLGGRGSQHNAYLIGLLRESTQATHFMQQERHPFAGGTACTHAQPMDTESSAGKTWAVWGRGGKTGNICNKDNNKKNKLKKEKK